MSDFLKRGFKLPPEQQAIRDKCFHPSGTFVEFPMGDVETSIPERFEKIVRKNPHGIAVQTEDQVVTYAELNAMANRVARAIVREQGSEAEPIGVLLEKGLAQIVAILGVLKAGKFLVPVDPSFPRARIKAVLQDSEAPTVITDLQHCSFARVVSGSACQVLELETIDNTVTEEDLRLCIAPNALACIFHTSGSTGKPKGVMQNHRNLLRNVRMRANTYHVCEQDRLSLLASGTSNAFLNMLLALLNGAVLLPIDVKKQGVGRLASWLSQDQISICWISSPLFRNLCEVLTKAQPFPYLRLIRLASETVYESDVSLYKKTFPSHCIFSNGLSSGETGFFRAYFIDHTTEVCGPEVPVGYAVDDDGIFLLDDQGREVGVNQIGEIVVRSRYLSPGYWRTPDLTNAKFKPDPDGGERRLYFTSDLGLLLPDGCLIHKGRKDFRVKIRGYGVDVAEVEKALRDYAAIKEAVVMAREDKYGEPRLVAYLTYFNQLGLTVSELRRFLKQSLSDYMIPSSFVRLEEMPLTPNGKIDRAALPDPGKSRPELDTGFMAPQTSVERQLTQIWAEVLSLDHVGIHDNFFDLGGDSLSAARVVSRSEQDYQVNLPLIQFLEAPTVAALADHIEKNLQTEPGADEIALKPVPKDSQLPLSFSQQRLWFLDQLEPGSFAYNLFAAYRLKGDLDCTALERSFNEIIRRHDSLRTVFASVDGAPVQIILPSLTLQVPLLDLRQIASGEEKQFEVDRISRAEAQRPFDLARGPLLRIMLLRLADDEYQLLRAMHHIVSDGWSGRILLRELAQCYQAFSTGQLSRLEDLPIQYATYAVWQRRKFKGAVLGAQVTYWKKQLENASTIELPTSRQRPAVPTSHGARHYFVLAETLSTGLKSLSRQRGVTLFTTLLAAFQTLLHRYSGQTDIVIGSPVGGRSRSEFEGLIGFFLNMLVLRTDLSGNPSFRELLSRVRQVCFGALAHQDLPFEKLVEKLQPERNLDRNPLFQVTFGFQNTPSFPLQLPGHKIDELEVHTGIARFDLHLFMEEEGQTLRGYFDYNAELFDADVIKQLIAHFGVLLEDIVVDPDRRLSELTILTEPERHQLLVEWNNTAKDYPRDMCLQELFEEQAEKSPDGIALMFEEQQLTYRELNQRANQLAHYLRGLGVGPERLVGICVERSLEMVIGLLGILKAGGAYVPLDPSYPKEWLKFMLEDTYASIILTDRVWLSSLPPTSARIVCLDRDREEINNEPRDNPDSESTADSLAYVIYTSGSTGVPKGVNVRHRGVVRLLLGVDYVQLNRAQTFLHLAPICFDAATFELWGALLHGGKCVLFPGRVPSPRELGAVLKKHRVTTLWLTAALFNTVINEEPQALSVVKQLLIGGEALSVPHVRKGLALLPNTEIINGYGPTESTTFTCCYPIPRQLDDNLSSIPVGKPIGNTQVYILDPHLKPVPVGVAGELQIGGDGLARGYLNRLELTAEKFIPNPFGAAPTSRLYKTGDRARYLPGGNIEFLGRIDNQVKIRGYRIELGEIETVLTQRSEVRESVVIAREDSAGDKQLVAYIVPQKSASATRELRTYLKDKLPGYMVPSAFVVLESFPLTPNGKVDRKALPSPDRNSADSAQVYVAPRNDVDEIIAGIWAEILGIRQIGVHDNFFDLGGHSLKATQVVSRLRRAFHSEIPLRHLFEFPTVAELAAAIRASEKQRVANPKDIDRLLTEIEAISEEKAQTLLAEKSALSASGHKHD